MMTLLLSSYWKKATRLEQCQLDLERLPRPSSSLVRPPLAPIVAVPQGHCWLARRFVANELLLLLLLLLGTAAAAVLAAAALAAAALAARCRYSLTWWQLLDLPT